MVCSLFYDTDENEPQFCLLKHKVDFEKASRLYENNCIYHSNNRFLCYIIQLSVMFERRKEEAEKFFFLV